MLRVHPADPWMDRGRSHPFCETPRVGSVAEDQGLRPIGGPGRNPREAISNTAGRGLTCSWWTSRSTAESPTGSVGDSAVLLDVHQEQVSPRPAVLEIASRGFRPGP